MILVSTCVSCWKATDRNKDEMMLRAPKRTQPETLLCEHHTSARKGIRTHSRDRTREAYRHSRVNVINIQETSRVHPENILEMFLRPQDICETSPGDFMLYG
ncbi:uncharacterized protein LOC116842395 [Odontomachus brunneus]|uniref:uncharacterized protein LOC116842395 n=1 Tax=Odontomachus brunneus TaxID=486640 RepID=UPI0013F1F6E3|nr:uncharacterized protein LOC116842395 [Odontomachus brunneus]